MNKKSSTKASKNVMPDWTMWQKLHWNKKLKGSTKFCLLFKSKLRKQYQGNMKTGVKKTLLNDDRACLVGHWFVQRSIYFLYQNETTLWSILSENNILYLVDELDFETDAN